METVLVIDDREDQTELIGDFLKTAGYDVLTTNKPQEGLDIVSEKNPDLIICDLDMPELNGMDVCYHLRNSEDIPFIPFMILTGVEEVHFQETSFSIGADEYLRKPVTMETLLEKVRFLLDQTKSFRELENTKKLEGIIKTVHDHTLLTLFQFLALNHQTGKVEILGSSSSGLAFFQKGDIVQAVFEEEKGLEAMIRIVSQNTGRFRFTTDESDRERHITERTMNLLMEACRIADERQNGPGD